MPQYFGMAPLTTTLKEYEMKHSALVAILLALSLTACGEKPAEEAAESAAAAEAAPAPETASTPETEPATSAPAAAATEAAPAEEPAAPAEEDGNDEPAQN